MNIILVRHGDAGKSSSGEDDIFRTLSPKGILTVKKVAKELKVRLDPDDEVTIWTSPISRAIQTAEIIAKELKIATLTEQDCIWDGDFSSFVIEVANLPENLSLIVAGHEPHSGLWSRELCGEKLEFEKGAVACFEIDTRSPLKGRLKWMIHPDQLPSL